MVFVISKVILNYRTYISLFSNNLWLHVQNNFILIKTHLDHTVIIYKNAKKSPSICCTYSLFNFQLWTFVLWWIWILYHCHVQSHYILFQPSILCCITIYIMIYRYKKPFVLHACHTRHCKTKNINWKCVHIIQDDDHTFVWIFSLHYYDVVQPSTFISRFNTLYFKNVARVTI